MFRGLKKRLSRHSTGSASDHTSHETVTSSHGTNRNTTTNRQPPSTAANTGTSTTTATATVAHRSHSYTVLPHAHVTLTQPLPSRPKTLPFRPHQRALWRQSAADLAQKSTHLRAFDACVQAADGSLEGSDQHVPVPTHAHASPIDADGGRIDPNTQLRDCSVLVSPDGELLLLPDVARQRAFGFVTPVPVTYNDGDNNNNNNNTTQPNTSPSISPNEHTVNNPAPTSLLDHSDDEQSEDDVQEIELHPTEAGFQALMERNKDAYEASVFVGQDLHATGDKAHNGFSAKGWSIPATSWACQQTQASLQHLLFFCEALAVAHKDTCAQRASACDNLRSVNPSMGGHAPQPTLASAPSQVLDPRSHEFEPTLSRVGPLLQGGSSLNAVLVALERYHAQVADTDTQHWKKASLDPQGLLPTLQTSLQTFTTRITRRQQALDETAQRARTMEDRLVVLKRQSDHAWNAVYQAEDLVTKRLEEILQEKSRQYEKHRVQKLRQERAQQQKEPEKAATPEEIWNMVNAATELMEDGNFEPMELLSTTPEPQPSSSSLLEDDQKNSGSDNDGETTTSEASSTNGGEKENVSTREGFNIQKIRTASRDQIEVEVGLPDLRQKAVASGEAVEDAAGTLLNILSNLDTARRSARIAAETALLGAGKAQIHCVRELVALERATLEERLRNLENVEVVLDEIGMRDIRRDLDNYITVDKRERGGRSHLGDDDDGGIASALAVLSSHVDGHEGSTFESTKTKVSDSTACDADEDYNDEDEIRTRIESSIESLFRAEALPSSDTSETDGAPHEGKDLLEAVSFLCKMATDPSSAAQMRRSTICYGLNAKRGSHRQIPTASQFDGLCRVCSAILTGCNSVENGVAIAKMCMMLSQTFYMEEESNADLHLEGVDVPGSPGAKDREKRVYVKNKLKNHAIWMNDDFWDEALSQQISESLTHSGVMANFDKRTQNVKALSRRNIEWTQTETTKWHDLNYTERVEAASQVQAVVFAQLGALAHSMIEFGCGLNRSCAFVRRMAIRNQLPSSQRAILLQHLMARNDLDLQEDKALSRKEQLIDS
jgi:hypothetical protein